MGAWEKPLRLRLAAWFAYGPLLLLGLVPRWLAQLSAGNEPLWTWSRQDWIGAWLVLNGAGLTFWCARLFEKEGQGTPMPMDPPKRLVWNGPYRLVRNPMALGVFLILAGEGLIYSSALVWAYAAVMAACILLCVHLVEEPAMGRRFGPLYDTYRNRVPAWLPKPTWLMRPDRPCD